MKFIIFISIQILTLIKASFMLKQIILMISQSDIYYILLVINLKLFYYFDHYSASIILHLILYYILFYPIISHYILYPYLSFCLFI